MSTIRLCQLNLLAPMWVNKEYKILPCYKKFTDPKRLDTTLSYLNSIKADIYCLCEVEARQLAKIDEAFPKHHRMFTSNALEFWSEWSDNKGEWIANGTCTLLDSSLYDVLKHSYINLGYSVTDPNIKGDGCRCTLVEAIHKASNYSILIATVHFDTEVKKFVEAFTLIEALDKLQLKKNFDIVLVSGDYNFTDVSTFERIGYVELVNEKEDTTPLPQGMIDHTLLFTSHKDIDFRGEVLKIHSSKDCKGRFSNDILSDVCATVSINGSDHYASLIEMRLL